ncbi:tRNA 5-carboxymethoxyuridine methyltransferase [subsurface metagenome]
MTKPPKFIFMILRTVLKFKNNPKKIREFLKLVGIKENMKVLDYGCGIGSYSLEAGKIVGESGTVIAAEINNIMLEALEKQIETRGVTNINPMLIKSMEDIEDTNFDFILLIDVLQLIEDKIDMIDSLLKKLSANGKLVIKFEHFKQDEIDPLLNGCMCSDKKLIYKKYWSLSK